jgi:flagellar protein FlaG
MLEKIPHGAITNITTAPVPNNHASSEASNATEQLVAPADDDVKSEAVSMPDLEKLAEATAKVSEFVQIVQRNLKFSVDEETGLQIVTVTDSETGELVRQIPSQEIINIAKNLADQENNGLLISTKS